MDGEEEGSCCAHAFFLTKYDKHSLLNSTKLPRNYNEEPCTEH